MGGKRNSRECSTAHQPNFGLEGRCQDLWSLWNGNIISHRGFWGGSGEAALDSSSQVSSMYVASASHRRHSCISSLPCLFQNGYRGSFLNWVMPWRNGFMSQAPLAFGGALVLP